MIIHVLHCPNCQGTAIVRHGTTRQGKQRYRCREHRGAGRTFLLDYSYPGQSSEEPELHHVTQTLLASLNPEQAEMDICRADELAQRRR
jgi:transposase-like protein